MAEEEQIIISELLCYMSCNINIYEKIRLIKSVKNYYSEEIISDTLDTLISSMPSENFKLRKLQEKNDAASTIYNYLNLIPKNEMPLFVCRDLNNLPNIESNVQADDFETEDDISSIRNQQHNMKCQIKEISESINVIKNQVKSMVIRAIKNHLNDTELSDISLSTEPSQNLAYLQRLIYKDVKKQEINDKLGDLFPSDELHDIPNHRTIKFETEDGHLVMTTSDDAINFDETGNAENLQKIEVSEDGGPASNKKNDPICCERELPVYKPFSDKIQGPDRSVKEINFKYKCSECSNQNYFNAVNHLCAKNTEHHNKSVTFKCKSCSFFSSEIVEVNDHLLSHEIYGNSEEKFECFWCSIKSCAAEELMSHLSCHTIVAPFFCNNCSFKTLDIQKLRIHWRRHWEEKGPHEFECQLCYKVCGTRQALDKHKLMHKRKYDHKCNYCGITYKNKSALTQHTLSHTKEKLFSCSSCSMVCESNHSLIQHVKIHENLKRNFCNICQVDCKNKQSYRIHILSKHPSQKNFPCDICNESFHFRRTLQVHRKKHINNEIFFCQYCSKKFKSKFYLKVHISKIHKKLPILPKS